MDSKASLLLQLIEEGESSALFEAIPNEHSQFILESLENNMLVDIEGFVNEGNDANQTPLHTAVLCGDLEWTEFLLNHVC